VPKESGAVHSIVEVLFTAQRLNQILSRVNKHILSFCTHLLSFDWSNIACIVTRFGRQPSLQNVFTNACGARFGLMVNATTDEFIFVPLP
jgi:hypothetical protein